MLELIERHQQKERGELHALEEERKGLDAQKKQLAGRVHVIQTRLQLLNELHAEVTTIVPTSNEMADEPDDETKGI